MFLGTVSEFAGNCIESCMDVRSSQQWFRSHTWNDEKQSDLGCLQNAS